MTRRHYAWVVAAVTFVTLLGAAGFRSAPGVLIVLSAGALLLAFGADFYSWRASGLAPDASGQGATVYAFLSMQGLLTAIAALMAAFLSARNSRGLIVRPRNNSYDLIVLFIAYTAAQGAISALLARLFPGAL